MDAKASRKFKKSVKSLFHIFQKQFPETTLILADPTRRIYWGDVSILEAGDFYNYIYLEKTSLSQPRAGLWTTQGGLVKNY